MPEILNVPATWRINRIALKATKQGPARGQG